MDAMEEVGREEGRGGVLVQCLGRGDMGRLSGEQGEDIWYGVPL